MTAERDDTVLLPGATLGVLGGGQLGRMFAVAAARLGYRVHVLADGPDSPAGQVALRETVAAYDDATAVAEFARSVDVVTYEFENVPTPSVEAAAAIVPVRPGPNFLDMTRHRGREKQGLADLGIPVAPFRVVADPASFTAAVADLGTPSLLKTAEFGYDGKGQQWIEADSDLAAAWQAVEGRECVLEGAVRFDRELSIVVCRGANGDFAVYDLVENEHVDGILDLSTTPAANVESLQPEAAEIARTIAEAYDVVGVFCIEFFDVAGSLVVNEIAPRPHNSGHLTIEGHHVSQFEQQVRAICGLPPGSTERRGPVAMANLVGPGYAENATSWSRAVDRPRASVHFYGKEGAPPGRKIGHVTALGDTPDEARDRALAVRRSLRDC